MCKFKNYPRTFHDNWEYPTQSFGCIVSSILPSTSLTPRRNWIYFRPLFATSLRLLFHTLLGFIVIIIIILSTFFHIYLSSNFPLYSIFTMTGFEQLVYFLFFLLIYSFLRIFSIEPVTKPTKTRRLLVFFHAQNSIVSTLLLGVDRRENWPFVPFFFNDGWSFER